MRKFRLRPYMKKMMKVGLIWVEVKMKNELNKVNKYKLDYVEQHWADKRSTVEGLKHVLMGWVWYHSVYGVA